MVVSNVLVPSAIRVDHFPSLKLPVSAKMLKQPQSNVFHQNPEIQIRLVAGERCLVQSGQGPEVVAHITAPQSKSSQKICDAQWKEWLSWAEQYQVDPVHP